MTSGITHNQPPENFGEEEDEHYRHITNHNGRVWILEFNQVAIGSCWLGLGPGDMEIFEEYAEQECRFIALYIGELVYRNRGIGTQIIHMLAHFAFERDNAAAICVNDIYQDRPYSLKAFVSFWS